MSDHSAIEWTDATWNPTTGCTKISPGCAHCYIERTPAFRIAGRSFDQKGHINLQLHTDRLEQPLHWKKPRRVFVNSLSDLFHDDVPATFIADVFATMTVTPRHTYQVLTKRPERMRFLLSNPPAWVKDWPLPNVWLGVSVENQHFADERIPLLLQTPAAVRFISAEPLLGPVGLTRVRVEADDSWLNALNGHYGRTAVYIGGPRLDWVIVGGESGPGARPFDVGWARSIVRQCQLADVPVFVKQLGARAYGPDVHSAILRDRKGGDIDEWPADLRVREYPIPRGTSQTSHRSQT